MTKKPKTVRIEAIISKVRAAWLSGNRLSARGVSCQERRGRPTLPDSSLKLTSFAWKREARCLRAPGRVIFRWRAMTAVVCIPRNLRKRRMRSSLVLSSCIPLILSYIKKPIGF